MNPSPNAYHEETSAAVAKLDAALGLRRRIVGVTYFFGRSDYERSPLRPAKSSGTYCSLVRLATCGHARKATGANIGCPGARRALGLTPPDEEYLSGRRYLSLGLYEDVARARDTAAQVSLMREAAYGVAVQPLESCETPPHVVICFCDPNQAMRLLQGRIYGHGPVRSMGSLGMQGVCAELTVRPFLTQEVNVSLLCSNTRAACAWGDGELGVGMPCAAFPGVVDGVLRTLDATETDRKKLRIAERSRKLATNVPVRLGTAYYLTTRGTPTTSDRGDGAPGKEPRP